MPQNASVKKEPLHNYRGTAPSVFNDVKGMTLRNNNRGAVLANIFERYVINGKLRSRDFAMCTRDIDIYMERIPKKERGLAKKAMMIHLDKRGYHLESK